MDICARRSADGYRMVSVNAASAYHCGGGVMTGGRHAMEEAWCMTTTLLRSLQRSVYLGHKLGLSKTVVVPGKKGKPEKEFHLHVPVDGCVLSADVKLFRNSSMRGYEFMSRPVHLAGIVSVAAFNKNPKVSDSPLDAPKSKDEYIKQVTEKWRATIGGALLLRADSIVIPDVGCGVFENDPKIVGACLNRILKEFPGYFQEVIVIGKHDFCTRALAGLDSEPMDFIRKNSSSAPAVHMEGYNKRVAKMKEFQYAGHADDVDDIEAPSGTTHGSRPRDNRSHRSRGRAQRRVSRSGATDDSGSHGHARNKNSRH